MNQKSLRRTGLDYIDSSIVHHYDNYQGYFDRNNKGQLYAIESNGKQRYTDCHFSKDASVIFGPETLSLPADILEALPAERILRIPIKRKKPKFKSRRFGRHYRS